MWTKEKFYRDQRNRSLALFDKANQRGDKQTALEHARDASYLAKRHQQELNKKALTDGNQ